MRFHLIPLLAVAALGCKGKPISDVPSLGATPPPNTTDRMLPGGPTLAASLALLDARVTDPAELDRRRSEFETKLNALVPLAADRETLGFQSLLSWHQLYTRGRSGWLKSARDVDQRLAELARPPKGFELRIDDEGRARKCPAGQPDLQRCVLVPGPAQLAGTGERLAEQLDGLLEAHWFLATGLDALADKLATTPAPPTQRN